MNFEQELKKALNCKYNYLKLLRVVYNTTFSECLVNFIYPEDKPIFTDEQKDEIKQAVINILNLRGRVECKFNKSYLDKNIVFSKLTEFLSINYESISTCFNEQTLDYEKDNFCVKICINANQTLLDYIENNNICEKIKQFLKENFCGDFAITTKKSDDDFDESLLDDRAEQMQANIKVEEKLPRYKVSEPMIVFGSEIMPLPEYIKNLKGEKLSCILAGKVELLTEKEYLPRRNKAKGSDEKMKYYTFKLNDESGAVNCIHFCNKTSQKHFKLIEEGGYVLCKGDYLKRNNGDMQYLIKAMALCHKLEEEDTPGIEEEMEVVPLNTYKFVKPEAYSRTIQNNLFEVPKVYPDYIMEKSYVVFDVETTGLEADKNDITEIGAVKIINGEIVEKFQALCKPFERIPDRIIQLTGITNEMVENEPLSTEIIEDFLLFCENSVLVGYNVHFDLNFIQNVARRINKTFNNDIRDCLMDARNKATNLPNYKLKTLVSHLGITLDNAHRALYDATATAEAFLALSLM